MRKLKKEARELNNIGLPPPLLHTKDLFLFVKRGFGPKDLSPLAPQFLSAFISVLRSPKTNSLRIPWTFSDIPSVSFYLPGKRGIFAPPIHIFPEKLSLLEEWLKESIETTICPFCGKWNFVVVIELKNKLGYLAIECGKISLRGITEHELLVALSKGGGNEKEKTESKIL